MTNACHQPAQCGISVLPGTQNALKKMQFAQIDGACYRLDDDLAVAQRRLFREWDHLEPDDYLRDGASFRRRRFALFYLNAGTNELLPLPSDTYFQAHDVNSYAGGISRRFAPLRPTAGRNQFLHELIRLLFGQLPIEPDRLSHPWLVDVHQIRITTTAKERGEPAPEGPHHDGEEFGVIQLVQRRKRHRGDDYGVLRRRAAVVLHPSEAHGHTAFVGPSCHAWGVADSPLGSRRARNPRHAPHRLRPAATTRAPVTFARFGVT